MLKEKHIMKMLKSVSRLYLGSPFDIKLRLTITSEKQSRYQRGLLKRVGDPQLLEELTNEKEIQSAIYNQIDDLFNAIPP